MLCGFLDTSMETSDEVQTPSKPKGPKILALQQLPEVDVYLHLLTLVYLIDSKLNGKVRIVTIIALIL